MPASIARTWRSASATVKPRPLRKSARHRIPELSDVLVCIVKNCALESESSQRCVYELVLRIRAACHA